MLHGVLEKLGNGFGGEAVGIACQSGHFLVLNHNGSFLFAVPCSKLFFRAAIQSRTSPVAVGRSVVSKHNGGDQGCRCLTASP